MHCKILRYSHTITLKSS